MNIIPIAANHHPCQSCGIVIAHLTTGSTTYPLDPPIHGLTERFDPSGMITAYDHLPVWPAHTCRAA